jgi:hypothetical protein
VIAGAVGLLAGNAAAALGAHEILRRSRAPGTAVDILSFLLVRLTLISAAILAAGLGGFLSPLGLGILGTISLAGLLFLGAHRSLPRLSLPRGEPLLVVATTVVAVRLLLQVWFFVPHLGDALAYHLPKIAEWVRAGAFTQEMGVHTHVTFPAGFELVETWWVVFLRHDVLIELAGVEFLVLAFFATISLARQVGVSGRWAWGAGLMYVLTPGLHLSATSCLNDAPAAALVVTTFALLASRASWGLVLVSAGLGIGIKPTYGFAIPGFLALAWMGRRESWRPSLSRTATVSLLTLALLLGGFWYGRNAVWFGNPFYPLGSKGFEDPTPVQFGPQGASLFQNLAHLVNLRIYDGSTLYGANVDHMAGWGATAFACGLVALVVGVIEDRSLRLLAAGFGISLLSSFLLIQDDPWCLKYVFWVPAILMVAVARLGQALPGTALIAGGGVLLSFLGTCFSYDLRAEHVRALASLPWRTRSASIFPYAQAEKERELAAEPIGYFGGPTGAPYVLYRPDFSRRVVYLRSKTLDGLKSDLTREKVQILQAPEPTLEQSALLAEGVRQGWMKKEAAAFYRVTAPTGSQTGENK